MKVYLVEIFDETGKEPFHVAYEGVFSNQEKIDAYVAKRWPDARRSPKVKGEDLFGYDIGDGFVLAVSDFEVDGIE